MLTLDLSRLSPLLTLVGVCLFLSRKQSRTGQIGRVLIGLGLIILALQLIVHAAEPITEARGMQVLFSSWPATPCWRCWWVRCSPSCRIPAWRRCC